MTEAQFLQMVREACNWHGLLSYHTHNSQRSDPGFPDLCIVGAKGIMFRELKTAVGRTTAMQDYWLARLNDVGVDADVWRPADFPDRVMQELKALGRLTTPLPARKPKMRKKSRP